jgi:hypothetical protein
MSGHLPKPELERYVHAVFAALPRDRGDALQVILHVTAGCLDGYDAADVTGYIMQIADIMDGKFDKKEPT